MNSVKKQYRTPTELEKAEILDILRLNELNDIEIAERYGVSRNTITGIRLGNFAVKNAPKKAKKYADDIKRQRALTMLSQKIHSSIIMRDLDLSAPQLSELVTYFRGNKGRRDSKGTQTSRLRVFTTENEHQTNGCSFLIENGESHSYCNELRFKNSYCQEHYDLCYVAVPQKRYYDDRY